MGAWSPSFERVPAAQFLLYCLAVGIFYRGLLAVQNGEIRCALIAGTLLYSSVLFHFVNEIGTDAPAAAGAIAILGFVLMRVGGQSGLLTLLAISITTFLTWLTRPAYLFLIPLVPSVCILAGKKPDADSPRTSRWRPGLEIIAAALLPVLAYCTLQWFVVGRFAVVSFGGYNLVGISGQFLDEETLNELPEHLKPLARKALEKRGQMQDQLAMPEAHRLNYLRMEQQYDDHIWRIFVPAAEEVLGEESNALINTQLRETATALIFARPRDYLIWLAKAFRRGMETLVSDVVLNPVSLVLFLSMLLAVFIGVVGFLNGCEPPFFLSRQTGVLFLIAFLFAAMKLAVVILVCIPIGRMTMAMGLFVPVVLTAFLADVVPRLASTRHAPKPPAETPRPQC
jgi:hypothetical protein